MNDKKITSTPSLEQRIKVLEDIIRNGISSSGGGVNSEEVEALKTRISELESLLSKVGESNDICVFKWINDSNAQELNEWGRQPYIGCVSGNITNSFTDGAGWYGILYFPHPSRDGFGIQLFIPYVVGSISCVYFRTCYAKSWSAAYRINVTYTG